MIIDNHNTECVICPYCSGVYGVLLYAPIVVGHMECVIYPYCSGVYGVHYIECDIKVVYGVGYVCVLQSPVYHY